MSGIPTDGRSIGHTFQIEAVVAFGVGVRFGLNPGELFDFILGCATIDIFNDDLERRRRIEQSNAGDLL